MPSEQFCLQEVELAHTTSPHLSITPYGCSTYQLRRALAEVSGPQLLLGGDRQTVNVHDSTRDWSRVEDALRRCFPDYKLEWK